MLFASVKEFIVLTSSRRKFSYHDVNQARKHAMAPCLIYMARRSHNYISSVAHDLPVCRILKLHSAICKFPNIELGLGLGIG